MGGGSAGSFRGTHHGDAVVEQRLSEHHDEEDLVDVDLLKHGDDGHGVDGGDEASKEEILQQTDVQVPCGRQKNSAQECPSSHPMEDIMPQ